MMESRCFSILLGTLYLLLLFTDEATALTTGKPKSIKLTYFNFPGAAEKIRLAFWLGGITFEDERIEFADWPALKPTTPYGQVPIMTIDDGPYISQSMAMLRFAADLAPELYPTEKMLEMEEIMGLVFDFERAWGPSLYIGMAPENFGYGLIPSTSLEKGSPEHGETVKAMRQRFLETDLPRFCKYFEDRITSSGGPFLCGSKPTLPDCCLFSLLEIYTKGILEHVPADCLEKFPAIISYIDSFQSLEEVVAYRQQLATSKTTKS